MEGVVRHFSEYVPYLEDIRRRFVRLVVAFIVFFCIGFFNAGSILKYVIYAFHLDSAQVVTTSPFQFLDLAMSVGIYAGLIACSPLMVYHIYSFLKDGLYRDEKKLFFLLVPISLFLFCAGFVYSFAILMFSLNSLAAFNASLGIQNFWDIEQFLSQIITTSALLGVLFEFPIVLVFLVKIGVIRPTFLREKRRHAVAAMFIVTSFLPPTDGLSLIIMVIPLIVIYEMTILACLWVYKRSR